MSTTLKYLLLSKAVNYLTRFRPKCESRSMHAVADVIASYTSQSISLFVITVKTDTSESIRSLYQNCCGAQASTNIAMPMLTVFMLDEVATATDNHSRSHVFRCGSRVCVTISHGRPPYEL